MVGKSIFKSIAIAALCVSATAAMASSTTDYSVSIDHFVIGDGTNVTLDTLPDNFGGTTLLYIEGGTYHQYPIDLSKYWSYAPQQLPSPEMVKVTDNMFHITIGHLNCKGAAPAQFGGDNTMQVTLKADDIEGDSCIINFSKT
jgi:hypothetical protein